MVLSRWLIQLERYFDSALEDPGGAGAGDIAEGGGRTGSSGPWVIEVGVIQDIEGLKPKSEVEAFMDGEDAGNLRIELIRRDTPERISAGVSESAGRHGIRAWI